MENKYFKEIIFSEEKIQSTIKELAAWVNEKYADSKDLVLISTMLGAVPFSMDLVKHVDILHELDFIGVKSYFGSNKQTDMVMIDKDIDIDITGKDVVILEDIVDSGRTLERIKDLLQSRNPKSLWILSLLKREENNVDFEYLKYGIEVKKNLFLVGYGLDYAHKFRNLQDIGILKDEYLGENK